jgi:hypothetical protein
MTVNVLAAIIFIVLFGLALVVISAATLAEWVLNRRSPDESRTFFRDPLQGGWRCRDCLDHVGDDPSEHQCRGR